MTALVCDLGGTGCRMALADGGSVRNSTYREMQNSSFPSFEDALGAYLGDQDGPLPGAAIIALAAPISGEDIELSNHDWRLSASSIAARSGIADIHFMNDLTALGYALRTPDSLISQPVLEMRGPDALGARLVLGIGTGFNSAACSPGGDVICSETGHLTFPVETPLDAALQEHFTTLVGRCSIERVLSGSGLGALYTAVCAAEGLPVSFKDSHEIIPAALNEDPVATRACAEFCRILGRTAGDLALTFMPKGGVWLAGGISRALAPMISCPTGNFARAFSAKGRFSPGMADFPVRLLKDDFAALRGGLARFAELNAAQTSRKPNIERAI